MFSLLAVIASVVVPIIIFRKQRKYDEEAERRRKQEIRQDAQDRLNAKRYANKDSFAKLAGVTKEVEETTYLEMKLKRR